MVKLFDANVGLAYKASAEFRRMALALDPDDVKQAALLGLWKASMSKKIASVENFTGYAMKAIRRGVWKLAGRHRPLMQLPVGSDGADLEMPAPPGPEQGLSLDAE